MTGTDFKKFLQSKDWELLQSSYTKDIKELMPYYDTAVEEIEQSSVMHIPPEYRYPLALSTMLGFLRNFRASTWKDCADLYEEQFHRWILEKNSAENVQIQTEIRNLTGKVAKNTKSIARSSRATAIFTGLMYLGL